MKAWRWRPDYAGYEILPAVEKEDELRFRSVKCSWLWNTQRKYLVDTWVFAING